MRLLRSTPLHIILCVLSGLTSAGAKAVELSLYCNPTQLPALREVVADWEKETGNRVAFRVAAESSSEALEIYRRLLEGESAEADICSLDSV